MHRLYKGTPEATNISEVESASSRKEVGQIFSSNAARGILINDLEDIMKNNESSGIWAEPIDDNIYKWSVKVKGFASGSDMARDMQGLKEQFGYDYLELQVDFAIGLYPYYPPLVKVVRPRLGKFMMQHVTNLDILKLTYWNPAKDMRSVLSSIRSLLSDSACLELDSPMNSRADFPDGAYVPLEHALLRLALTTEITPRVSISFSSGRATVMAREHTQTLKRMPEACDSSDSEASRACKVPRKDTLWASGTGYGVKGQLDSWDPKAAHAAQREKDDQIEIQIKKIEQILRQKAEQGDASGPLDTVRLSGTDTMLFTGPNDEEIYNILEGSVLIPLFERYFSKDAPLLEIERQKVLYLSIAKVTDAVASHPMFSRLLDKLPNQATSVASLITAQHRTLQRYSQYTARTRAAAVPVERPNADVPPTEAVTPEGQATKQLAESNNLTALQPFSFETYINAMNALSQKVQEAA